MALSLSEDFFFVLGKTGGFHSCFLDLLKGIIIYCYIWVKEEEQVVKPTLISWDEAIKYTYHSGTLLVDLRDEDAYQKGHVSGAWNVPYEQLEQSIDQMMNYDRIIFYCDFGNHSLQAAKLLAKKGKWASSIAGGYEGRNRKRR